MDIILNEIISNDIYVIITAVLAVVIIFSVLKRIMKLFIYAVIALAAFFGYLYYTGETIADTVKQGEKAVEKAKETAEEKKEEIEAIKKKGEEQLKK